MFKLHHTNLASVARAGILIVFILMTSSQIKAQFVFEDFTEYSYDDLDNQYRTIFLPDSWKFKNGDNPEWADQNIEDWDWMTISTTLNPATLEFIDWDQVGWFRTSLKIDSTLVGIPLALEVISQSGRSDIYLNGREMFQIGNNGSFNPSDFISNNLHIITFPRPGLYTIAIRFENPEPERFSKHNLAAGFHYALVDADYYITNVLENTRSITRAQAFFGGTLLIFGLIHFLLFLYYRKQPENLYFALFTLSFALFIALSQQMFFTYDLGSKLILMQGQEILKALSIIFFMRFLYELLCSKVPEWRFGLFTSLVLMYLIYALINPVAPLHIYLDIILILAALESGYILYRAIQNKRDGAVFFGVGLGFFLLCHMLIIGANFDLVDFSQEVFGAFGTGALLIAMSVSLSRNVAKTNSRLELKLKEVKTLSNQALERERRLKKEELERKLLEADNNRKTAELEEARRLQLSMLPKTMPETDHLDITAHMVPATEVGGDYYDYHRHEDGTITFAVGDATGHGLKAGIVVATVKSFFHTHVGRCSNLELMHRMSEAVKNMNLHMMYMGLTLIRVSGKDIEITVAGMPPLIYVNGQTGKSELLILKGMPLGSVLNFPYKSSHIKLEKGDSLTIPSDGLPELFNSERQMYDYSRIQAVIEKYHKKNPRELMHSIIDNARKWSSGTEQEDDITLMIMKSV